MRRSLAGPAVFEPPMKRSIRICLPLCAALVALLALAPAASARIGKRKIGNFDSPVYVTGAPGFRKLLFVVEQPGSVSVVRGHHKLGHAFLNLRDIVGYDGAERGLLSIAFPPDYKQSGHFYVDYNDKQGNINVVEFQRRGPTRARKDSARLLLQIDHRANANHNGGQLQFLGNLLYISTGDGGAGGDPPNNAQNLNSLLGKILRIDPHAGGGQPYTIPADNPFVGKPGRDEIFSYGLRNPWRFSFNLNGAGGPYIAIGDAGQERFEEVDYERVSAASGANFGWDAFEGFAPYTGEDSGTPDPGGTTKPIFTYGTHSDGNCTIIGGLVVHDRHLRGLRGRYLYSDFCAGNLRSLVPSPSGARGDRRVGLHIDSPSAFGQDNRGRVYVTSLDGPLYRLVHRR
jgi:Glucose / Sorbosone dehydrogenase